MERQRKHLTISTGFVALGLAFVKDPFGHIEMVLSNWPLIWAFVPAVGIAVVAGGGMWLTVTFGAWIINLVRRIYEAEREECIELADELVHLLEPKANGWPVAIYIQQKNVVEKLKDLKLLHPDAEIGAGLRDVCMVVLDILQRRGVNDAREYIRKLPGGGSSAT